LNKIVQKHAKYKSLNQWLSWKKKTPISSFWKKKNPICKPRSQSRKLVPSLLSSR